MTKKLFALVMVAIMSVTMFTFPAFAEGGANLVKDSASNKLTLTWQPIEEATIYEVTFYKNDTKVSGTTVPVTNGDKGTNNAANCTATYTPSVGGCYTAQVIAYVTKGGKQCGYYTSNAVDIPVTGTGSNGVKVSGDASSTVVTWTSDEYVPNYYVSWTTAEGTSGQYTSNSSCNIPVAISKIKSITVYKANKSSNAYKDVVGSWTNNGSSSGPVNSNGLSISADSTTARISWNSVTGAIYYRVLYANATSKPTTDNGYNYSNNLKSTYYTLPVSSISATYIKVQAYVNGVWIDVGDGVAYPNYNNGTQGGGSTTIGGLAFSKGSSSTTVSWNAINGASIYVVTYRSATASSETSTVAYTNSTVIPLGSSDTYTITVVAYVGNSNVTVGTATVTPYNTSTSNGSAGSTTAGNNCTVVSYPTYALLTWKGNSNTTYQVIVSVSNNTTQSTSFAVTGTSCQLPVSSTYSYAVLVLNGSSVVANASVAAKNLGTSSTRPSNNITKSEVVGLTATANGWKTTVSWDKKGTGGFYTVEYAELNAVAGQVQVTTSTSYDIPFSANTAYKVFVTYTANGITTAVGHIYNVPGSTAATTPTTPTVTYPASFKGVSSDSKITLYWDAVSGATSYTIYYKKSASSTWLKAGSTAKTAVNIKPLTNGTKYDFKVVPNKGAESGIVTIAPSTTSTTVRAKDPTPSSSSDDGDVNLDDESLQILTATSNSTGKITLTWNDVGAASYRIYVAESNSSNYKYCGTATKNSATFSKFGTGTGAANLTSGKTYKIRVVRSDYSDLKTALSACQYVTVKVK